MNGVRLTRKQILTIGPALLVATCYAIAAPSYRLPHQEPVTIDEEAASDDASIDQPLNVRCLATAKSLRAELFADWSVIIHEPFILGGDLSEQELEDAYEQTIVPTARALARGYFSRRPRQPLTILLCSSDERFHECNLRLDNQERRQYAGLYVRKHRRVMVNLASGEGTLAHELTHALAHADFPSMPEWFDEGLASLHEECQFSDDGLRLIGNENWRLGVAVEALHRGELRLLQDVTSKRFGSSERANTDYAYVRSMCLYLQERGLLEAFYRECRANSASDPTGLHSLCDVTNSLVPAALDDAFRAWLIHHQSSVIPEKAHPFDESGTARLPRLYNRAGNGEFR